MRVDRGVRDTVMTNAWCTILWLHPSNKMDDNTDEIQSIISQLLQRWKDLNVARADIEKKPATTSFRSGILSSHWFHSLISIRTLPEEDSMVSLSAVVPHHHRQVQAQRLLPTTGKKQHVPLLIATVNTPCYQSRLQLDSFGSLVPTLSLSDNDDDVKTFAFAPIDMLNLSLGTPHTTILPSLQFEEESIVLVAKDDFRLCETVTPTWLYEVCIAVFDANPHSGILSLGYACAPPKLTRTAS